MIVVMGKPAKAKKYIIATSFATKYPLKQTEKMSTFKEEPFGNQLCKVQTG